MKAVLYIAILFMMITFFVSCEADLEESGSILASDPELLMLDAKTFDAPELHFTEEFDTETLGEVKESKLNVFKLLFPDAKKHAAESSKVQEFEFTSHAAAQFDKPGLNFISNGAENSVLLRDFQL